MTASSTAAAYGYTFRERPVVEAYSGLRSAAQDVFPHAVIAYAVKCNPLPQILATLAGLGAWLEVAWPREARLAIDSGVPGPQIIWGGCYRSDAVYEQAAMLGALTTFESLSQLKACDVEVPRCIRVRARSGSRFGLPLEQLRHACQLLIDRGVTQAALQVHQSGGNWPPTPSAWAERATVVRTAAEFLDEYGLRTTRISLGGGLPEPHTPEPDRRDFRASALPFLLAAAQELGDRLDRTSIVLEPGRFLVQHSGRFSARVIDIRDDAWRPQLLLDAGVCSLGSMSSSDGEVRILSARPGDPKAWTLLGPSNREDDRLGSVLAASPDIGDTVEFDRVGAYQHAFRVGFAEELPEVKWIPSELKVGG